MIKETPKSCSCGCCKRGKHSKYGKILVKYDERKFRHASKIKLNKGEEVVYASPIGNYYD